MSNEMQEIGQWILVRPKVSDPSQESYDHTDCESKERSFEEIPFIQGDLLKDESRCRN
jgi:hypothetical protein